MLKLSSFPKASACFLLTITSLVMAEAKAATLQDCVLAKKFLTEFNDPSVNEPSVADSHSQSIELVTAVLSDNVEVPATSVTFRAPTVLSCMEVSFESSGDLKTFVSESPLSFSSIASVANSYKSNYEVIFERFENEEKRFYRVKYESLLAQNFGDDPSTESVELQVARDYGHSSGVNFYNSDSSVGTDGLYLLPQSIALVQGNAGTGWLSLTIGDTRYCYQGNARANNRPGDEFVLAYKKEGISQLNGNQAQCFNRAARSDVDNFELELSVGTSVLAELNGGGCKSNKTDVEDGACLYTEVDVNLAYLGPVSE